MTDINKTIMEKAAGPTRFNPDEQRRFLETYEERVIASCTLEEARDKMYLEQYSTILTNISERFEPVLVKISPALDESLQLQYLKQTKDLGLVASIVSDDCRPSPFGIIIHTDHPSGISPTEMSLQYPELFQKKESTGPEKRSFWKRLFG
ncbi:DUF1694 domain-containing protein [Streptococcus sp.]